MINNKILVTTALEATWDDNVDIIFLGEWCKKYSRMHKWSGKKYKTIKWHWTDRNKIRKDYDYISVIYEEMLNKCSLRLNHIHNESNSIEYWRVVIGPWLLMYIGAVLDRWESIRCLDGYKVLLRTIVPNKSIEREIADDYSDSVNLMGKDDLWNYVIFCDILEVQNIPTIELIKRDVKLGKKVKGVKKQGTYIDLLIEKIDSFVGKTCKIKNYNFLLYKSYFSLNSLIRLTIRIKQIPRLFSEFDKQVQYSDYKSSVRMSISDNLPKIDFEQFLLGNILKDMPKSYIEGYKDISFYCNKLPKANIIMTANAHIYNEVFKIWSAKQISKGSKLIVSQHGGSLIQSMDMFACHEEEISHKKIVWHMPLKKSHVQLPPNKKINNNISQKGTKITLIGVEFTRYVTTCQSGALSSLALDDFKQKCDFINELDKLSRKDFKIRPYPDVGWSFRSRYSDIYGKSIISSNRTLSQDFSNSKLIICSYPQTTFLEAMSSGVPTILLYTEQYWEIFPFFDNLIKELKEASIVFSDPFIAAKHINTIHNNPLEWWDKSNTVKARDKFINTCTKVSDNPLKEWSDFFVKVLDG